MLSRPLGMVIDVRDRAFLNASEPIVFKLAGSVIVDRAVALSKAFDPIVSTFPSICTLRSVEPFRKSKLPISIVEFVVKVSTGEPRKTFAPILCKLAGKVIDLSDVLVKAFAPILITLFGSIRCERFVFLAKAKLLILSIFPKIETLRKELSARNPSGKVMLE
jgi:hypothetical protein